MPMGNLHSLGNDANMRTQLDAVCDRVLKAVNLISGCPWSELHV